MRYVPFFWKYDVSLRCEKNELSFGGMLQAESLGKKYEEKYKQVVEIASKLTIEEAKFHDI